MRIETRIPRTLGLFPCLVLISACPALAQAPQKTIHSPDGWVVKYGVVQGASTQPAAIVSELRAVARSCGESPQVGQAFRYKGTSTVGVFYVVTNHSAGEAPMVGLILSDFNEKKQVETAVMYDTAPHFRYTLKPMMETVFKEWRPGGVKPAAKGGTGASAALLPMHPVTLPDGSAAAKIPDGWQVTPQSHGGGINVVGPHQEFIMLNGGFVAQDPRAESYQRMMRMHMQSPPNEFIMPYNADLGRAVPYMYAFSAHLLRWNPTDLKIEQTQIVPMSQGLRCVQAQGHVNNFGTGPMELNATFCPGPPSSPQTMIYMVYVFFSLVPNALADQERLTTFAVMASFSWDQQRVERQAAAMAAPVIQQMQGIYQQHMDALNKLREDQIGQIHRTGQEVTDRIAEADRQQAIRDQDFDKQEENIGRYGQGFSNYILDQNVIQYTNSYGDFAHKTVPNNIAYSLVQQHPDQVELVPTPNYIPDVDFRQ